VFGDTNLDKVLAESRVNSPGLKCPEKYAPARTK
jgi:hypothetical protein